MDYSSHKYNIGSYISLEMTLVWGIATVIFIYIINPILNVIVKNIPKYITIVLLLGMIVDFCLTIYHNLKK